ncbi:hypothetical protein ACJMK2_019874 [Sinanodonta woodiana]|uniref:3-beta hydroxysteroid dehydrogenase/isomerase domain-containing protein n=1 Tax=Sinanodonta woodiana TaxID=1069815 RepID=A0ABD3U0M1_SINWO
MEKGTVLVTGGAGFLGQHVVELLQSSAEHVTDIRIFDMEPYINKLGYQERKPVKSIIGSVLDTGALQEACKGVDAVFHLTGCVDTRMFPDVQKLNAVNVQGTENVIQACKKGNVKRLIYCSTVDVVIGRDGHVFNGTETTTSIPQKSCFFFGPYAETKQKAEELVLKANGSDIANGGKLRTLSLRPTVMYGELDKYFVTEIVRTACTSKFFRPINSGSSVLQCTYVRNAAWCFLCAERTLRGDNSIAGQSFFVCDDTPLTNMFEFSKPYLRVHGIDVNKKPLPFWPVVYLFYFLWCILWVIFPVFQFNISIGICSILSLGTTMTFSSNKAQTLLLYKPIYSHKQAQNMSLKFYRTLKF